MLHLPPMRILWLSLFFFVGPLHAQGVEELSFKNVREGKSIYSKGIHRRAAHRVLERISTEELVSVYSESLQRQNPSNACAFDLRDNISDFLNQRSMDNHFKGVVYVLRSENLIDDVVAGILLKAEEVRLTTLRTKDERQIILPLETDNNTAILKLIGSFNKRFSEETCFDDAYKNLSGEIRKLNKHIQSFQIEALYLKALQTKLISRYTYTKLEQARLAELETVLTLSEYHQKIKTLRVQYPLRDEKEKSDFVSAKLKKSHLSRRQNLLSHYTPVQIIIMGNVIKKVRSRLEYDSVTISGFKDGSLMETIPLQPMERFRFAIKVLRKEMSLLATNTNFKGRTPSYMDLMVASYEIGIIPASELDAVASLEEIWNPKKTFWDKAGVWVKTFSSVATIVIPAPYGFIPALAVVIIDATVGKKRDTTENDPTSLF